MKTLNREDLWDLTKYEMERPQVRADVIQEKNRRRVALGEHLTLLFENRRTVWYQVQEMLRTERIVKEAAIAHEMATYNELIPKPAHLSATLLIEYADPTERDLALAKLLGLEKHLFIEIDGAQRFANWDEHQYTDQRISSVQFIQFNLDGMTQEKFLELAQQEKIGLVTNHPEVAARTTITGNLAETLAEDLA